MSFGLVLLALGGGFFFAALASADGELVSWFAGFGMIFAAVGLMVVIRCLNAVRPEDLAVLDDANAVAYFAMPRPDRYGILAGLLLITAGFGLWAIDGFLLLFQILGAVAAVVSMCGLIAMLRTEHRPALRLSPEGLEFSGLDCGIIDWRDIRSAEASNGRVPMVLLELRNERKYAPRRPKRWWRAAGFAVSSPILGLSTEMIVKAIDIRRKAFEHAGQRPA